MSKIKKAFLTLAILALSLMGIMVAQAASSFSITLTSSDGSYAYPGSTLTVTTEATATYQWYLTPSTSSSYQTSEYAISGATGSSYTVTADDYDNGSYIQVVATGTGDYDGYTVSKNIQVRARTLKLNVLEIIDGDETTTIDSGTGTTIGLRTVYPGYVINATPTPEDATVTYQ